MSVFQISAVRKIYLVKQGKGNLLGEKKRRKINFPGELTVG